MNRILKIGMDVHSTNYTLCIVEPKIDGDPDRLYEVQVEPDYLNIVRVISNLKKSTRTTRYTSRVDTKQDALDTSCTTS